MYLYLLFLQPLFSRPFICLRESFYQSLVGTSPASHRASTTQLFGSRLSINQVCSCSEDHYWGPHSRRQPYRDQSWIVDRIARSPRESLQGSESSRWPPLAICLTRRKTWAGAAQPGCAFCPHPPKSSPPRLTDGHAP